MIVLNFKTYQQSTGLNAIRLAKIAKEVANKTGVTIIVCPSVIDIKEVRELVDIPIYAQHIDNIEFGAYTGYLSPKMICAKGADGTILNHAEHRLEWNVLKQTVFKVKKEGLKVILCAENVRVATKQLELFPDEIALEIPELIGGNISISNADPRIIKDAVRTIGEKKILVGSGIKTANDIKTALDLGVKGVILASAFDLAENPHKTLLSLAKAFI